MINYKLYKPIQLFILAGTITIFGACASTSEITSDTSPIGAWASGDDLNACETAPITYFSSDGVIIVFLLAEGPLHSFGRWEMVNDQLVMTHNDFPLDGSGISKAPVSLDIIELDSKQFVTKNLKGEVRRRVKCDRISLNSGSGHAPH